MRGSIMHDRRFVLLHGDVLRRARSIGATMVLRLHEYQRRFGEPSPKDLPDLAGLAALGEAMAARGCCGAYRADASRMSASTASGSPSSFAPNSPVSFTGIMTTSTLCSRFLDGEALTSHPSLASKQRGQGEIRFFRAA